MPLLQREHSRTGRGIPKDGRGLRLARRTGPGQGGPPAGLKELQELLGRSGGAEAPLCSSCCWGRTAAHGSCQTLSPLATQAETRAHGFSGPRADVRATGRGSLQPMLTLTCCPPSQGSRESRRCPAPLPLWPSPGGLPIHHPRFPSLLLGPRRSPGLNPRSLVLHAPCESPSAT